MFLKSILDETTFANFGATLGNSMLHDMRFNETSTIGITMLQFLDRFQKPTNFYRNEIAKICVKRRAVRHTTSVKNRLVQHHL